MYGSCSNFPNESEASGGAGNGIMLFGVRVMEGSFRKSASMNNLAQFEQPRESTTDVATGYASDDIVHASARSRERKRGVPWTEEEHKLFLLGLQKVGKGDWRGISRNFVKTRTPTQVASHAQKYFLRRNNHNRRRRRSSLFDMAMEDRQIQQEAISHDKLDGFPSSVFPGTINTKDKLIRTIPMVPVPPSSKMADLNFKNATTGDSMGLSLKLSSPSPSDQKSPATRHSSSFHGMSGNFSSSSSGDSIISVA